MKKEIKVGAILGYVNMIVNIFVSLLYTPFMLKMMGQSEYGLYSLVASVIAYLSVLDMGFGNAMVRFVSRTQARKEENESAVNGMFLILYIIIGIISLFLGWLLILKVNVIFGSSLTSGELAKSKLLILILVVNVALSFPLSVFDSYVIANEKYIYIKIFTILKSLMKPMLMTPLLFFGYKSIGITFSVAVINILYHISMFIYCIKVLKMKFTFSFKSLDKTLLKEITFYSFFVFLNIIVDNVFNNTDQIILGIVSGTAAVSIYAVASQIVQMNTQCSTVISSLFLPKITKLLETENFDKKISDLFIKVSRIQMYIMMLILFGFLVFGQYFVCWWAGRDYLDAYKIILILIIPSVVPLTQNLAISVIQAKNMHQFRSIIYVIIAVLNILISIPLAKLYQGVGAAIGSAFANLLGQIIIMNIFYYKKVGLNIPRYWKFFFQLFLQFSILSLVFLLINQFMNMNFVVYIFEIICFISIYFVIVYVNMDNLERSAVLKGINKFFPFVKLQGKYKS